MICKIRETINRWVSSPPVEIQTTAMRMIVMFEKYWTILDPKYKMLRVDFYFRKLYGFDASRQQDKESKALMGSTLVGQVEESSSFDHSIEVLTYDEEYELYKSKAISSIDKSERDVFG
ncbi:hypothetical protein ACOSP7_028374 [Xanthoceras sorbifolium]